MQLSFRGCGTWAWAVHATGGHLHPWPGEAWWPDRLEAGHPPPWKISGAWDPTSWSGGPVGRTGWASLAFLAHRLHPVPAGPKGLTF